MYLNEKLNYNGYGIVYSKEKPDRLLLKKLFYPYEEREVVVENTPDDTIFQCFKTKLKSHYSASELFAQMKKWISENFCADFISTICRYYLGADDCSLDVYKEEGYRILLLRQNNAWMYNAVKELEECSNIHFTVSNEIVDKYEEIHSLTAEIKRVLRELDNELK